MHDDVSRFWDSEGYIALNLMSKWYARKEQTKEVKQFQEPWKEHKVNQNYYVIFSPAYTNILSVIITPLFSFKQKS